MTMEIYREGVQAEKCVSAILVPEMALAEPGYIKTMTAAGAGAQSKHEFFAMAQMAYYQFQDGELDILTVTGPVTVRVEEVVEEVVCGMVLYRDENAGLHVLMHAGPDRKKMLETTNRYCTRWVRLDI